MCCLEIGNFSPLFNTEFQRSNKATKYNRCIGNVFRN